MELLNQSKECKKDTWLRQEAGTFIDALEGALNSFVPSSFDSLIFLRQQIRMVRKKIAELEMPDLAMAAESALDSGPLNVRVGVETLIALMRKAAHVGRNSSPSPQELDVETGLLNADGFVRRIAENEHAGNTHAAVGVIQLADADTLRAHHGNEIITMVLRHVAAILSDQLRQEDHIARMGPCGFAVLLPAEDTGGLNIALARIVDAVARKPFTFPDGHAEAIRVTSCGYQLGSEDRSSTASAGSLSSETIIGTLSGIVPQTKGVSAYRIGVAMRNKTTTFVLASLLERAGYEVVAAGTGDTNRVQPFTATKLHLVILDDAPTSLNELRAALGHRRTPVIVIADNAEIGQWAMRNGAREYLVKPVRTEVLLAAVKRLVLRGRAAEAGQPASSVLVASDDVTQLIALGSSLQKQGHFSVRLGRGCDDAMAQIQRNVPAAVLIEMSLRRAETVKFLNLLSGVVPPPVVVLIISEAERPLADSIKASAFASILVKPVTLLTLHAEVQRAIGKPLNSGQENTQVILRNEILRVMCLPVLPLPTA